MSLMIDLMSKVIVFEFHASTVPNNVLSHNLGLYNILYVYVVDVLSYFAIAFGCGTFLPLSTQVIQGEEPASELKYARQIFTCVTSVSLQPLASIIRIAYNHHQGTELSQSPSVLPRPDVWKNLTAVASQSAK